MIFNINYNPYSNKIHFLEEGEEIRDGSSFLKYQKNKIIFQNCVEEILQLINKYENITPDGVDIEFEGTDEDYQILIDALDIFGREQGYQGIRTIHKRRLISSSDAIKKIRDCYDQIEKEFEPYIVDEQTNHNNVLGKKVIKFTETVKPEIPVCVIGNYSVGKSAFINALIGREVLPSKLKACTAKNVIVRNDTSYSISITRVIDGEECRYTFRIDRNGKIFVSAIGSVSKNDALIETLSKELDIYDNPDVIVYNILDRINSFGKDSVTDVNVTVVHKEEGLGKAEVAVHSDYLGEVKAELSVRGNEVKGFILADSQAALEQLRQAEDGFREQLNKDGLSVKQIDLGFYQGMKQTVPENGSENVDTKTLLKVAKTFISMIRTIEQVKGESYVN